MGLLNTSNDSWKTPIEQGISQYFQERDKTDEKNRQNKLMQIGMKEHGLMDDGQGGLSYDPETQSRRDIETQSQAAGLEQQKAQLPRQQMLDQAGLLEKGVQQTPEGGVSWSPDQVQRRAIEDRKQRAEAGMYEAHAKNYLADKSKENISKDATAAQNYLGKDKNYGTAKNMIDLSEQAKDQIQLALSNPVAKNNLPTILSNIAGHGQRLHTSTMEQQKGDQSMLGRISQMIKSSGSGTITPANAKFMNDWLETMVASTKKGVTQTEMNQAKKFMQTHKGTDLPTAYELITGNPMGAETPATGMLPQQGLMQSANSKPKSVIQNGHTYMLNEQTGQYE